MKSSLQRGILTVFAACVIGPSLGQIGNYLQLDGVTGYVQVLDHDDLDVNDGEDFTVTVWAQSGQSGDYPRLVHKRMENAGTGYELMANPTGRFAVNLEDTSNNKHGTAKEAKHPVEILYNRLK